MKNVRPTVLITGGQGDLGQALAIGFNREQWRVLSPGKHELDVTSAESVTKYFSSLGPLDLLVNNAGVIEDHSITRMTEASWENVMSVNLRGCFLCTRAAVEQMQPRRRGQVLFIGSRAAHFGTIGQSNYAATKAALIGFSQSLAKEHGQDNLRFNVVLPGFLETKMNRLLPLASRQSALAQHVLGRFNTVQEAARTVVFLASTEALSGQVFQLDSRVDAWT